MVHRREVDGQEIILGNQGALFGNAMTWWDTETGSIWSQPVGEAILGPLAGTRLELLPSVLISWSEWKLNHPDTLALDVPSGNDGFDLEVMALVVELGPESTAYPVAELRKEPVVNDVVNGVPVAVVLQPDSETWHVFSRQLDDETVELELVDGELVTTDGSKSFELIRGLGTNATTENLDQLPGFTSFPADYVTFFPDGRFWTTEGDVPVSGLEAGQEGE